MLSLLRFVAGISVNISRVNVSLWLIAKYVMFVSLFLDEYGKLGNTRQKNMVSSMHM